MGTRDWAGNIQIFQTFPEQLCGRRSIKVSGCSHDWHSQSGRDVATQNFSLRPWFSGRRADWELTRRSIQKLEKNVKFFRYNNHICYVSDMNSFFESFRCSTCDAIFSKTGNLVRNLIPCSKRVKHIHPKNVNQLRETFFEKLDSFILPYREDQKLIKNLAIFNFQSVCVKGDTYKETGTTKWLENMSLYQLQFRQT